MGTINRRVFLLAAAAMPAACALVRHDAGADALAQIRLPAVGQSWRYAKHDLFTRAVLETQIDQVTAVGGTIDLSSHYEGGPPRPAGRTSTWGLNWLRSHAGADRSRAELPSEIQSSWGMVLVDPHWNQVQVYKDPVPLWPTVLRPGWHNQVSTRYRTSEDGDGLPWQQTMKADAIETATVPAGTFRTLRYTNLINFRSTDATRGDSVRHETAWFAPEIGRWVARESAGHFYVDDSAADQPYNESSFRWELLAWT